MHGRTDTQDEPFGSQMGIPPRKRVNGHTPHPAPSTFEQQLERFDRQMSEFVAEVAALRSQQHAARTGPDSGPAAGPAPPDADPAAVREQPPPPAPAPAPVDLAAPPPPRAPSQSAPQITIAPVPFPVPFPVFGWPAPPSGPNPWGGAPPFGRAPEGQVPPDRHPPAETEGEVEPEDPEGRSDDRDGDPGPSGAPTGQQAAADIDGEPAQIPSEEPVVQAAPPQEAPTPETPPRETPAQEVPPQEAPTPEAARAQDSTLPSEPQPDPDTSGPKAPDAEDVAAQSALERAVALMEEDYRREASPSTSEIEAPAPASSVPPARAATPTPGVMDVETIPVADLDELHRLQAALETLPSVSACRLRSLIGDQGLVEVTTTDAREFEQELRAVAQDAAVTRTAPLSFQIDRRKVS